MFLIKLWRWLLATLSSKTGVQNFGAIYETGTANAAFTTTGGSATINASVRTITWAKIGRVVFISGRLDMSSISSPTGTLKITGLPYAAASDCAVVVSHVIGRSFDSLTQNLKAKVLNTESAITIEEFEDGDTAAGAPTLNSLSTFIIGGSYLAAS